MFKNLPGVLRDFWSDVAGSKHFVSDTDPSFNTFRNQAVPTDFSDEENQDLLYSEGEHTIVFGEGDRKRLDVSGSVKGGGSGATLRVEGGAVIEGDVENVHIVATGPVVIEGKIGDNVKIDAPQVRADNADPNKLENIANVTKDAIAFEGFYKQEADGFRVEDQKNIFETLGFGQ